MFFSFFQTLVERQTQIMVELKNDLQITGALHSVDQFLNIKLNNVSVADPEKCPHLLSIKNCFVRGSAVRYVHLPPSAVDLAQLQDLCRRESANGQDKEKK
ncbi:putative U6 snRNA-associated sm family protein Lsm2 [Besnoitia besnoiti]|uniref:U6 snRNA-associated Sm-like protein LSm2 n=1 Tax=Besnoitia besnoiti TaxID=94643 RepID=A0A2A9MGN0_BESBE|nr:putative U6 snRNA-associated sm family protein Lsm2 [Besnoitia besnoiti]PFH35411.1 putative U6 snRNA-associated sm family protein Lsm2 [Besnoitia besnoiti]